METNGIALLREAVDLEQSTSPDEDRRICAALLNEPPVRRRLDVHRNDAFAQTMVKALQGTLVARDRALLMQTYDSLVRATPLIAQLDALHAQVAELRRAIERETENDNDQTTDTTRRAVGDVAFPA